MKIYTITKTLVTDCVYNQELTKVFVNEERALEYFHELIDKDKEDSRKYGWKMRDESQVETDYFYESWAEEGNYISNHCRIQYEEMELDDSKPKPKQEYVVTIPYISYREVFVHARNEKEAVKLALEQDKTMDNDDLVEHLEIDFDLGVDATKLV